MDQRQLLYQLKAVASAPRLTVLRHLQRHRTAANAELAGVLRLSPKTTFYHLSRLVARGIVKSVRRGGEVRYRLSLHQEQPVRQVLSALGGG